MTLQPMGPHVGKGSGWSQWESRLAIDCAWVMASWECSATELYELCCFDIERSDIVDNGGIWSDLKVEVHSRLRGVPWAIVLLVDFESRRDWAADGSIARTWERELRIKTHVDQAEYDLFVLHVIGLAVVHQKTGRWLQFSRNWTTSNMQRLPTQISPYVFSNRYIYDPLNFTKR